MKRILTVCAALLMIFTAAIPAFAATGEEFVTVAGASNGQELIATSPAVVYNSGGRCLVVADTNIYASGAAEYVVLLGERTYEMAYCEEWTDQPLSVFEMDSSYLSYPQVLNVAPSVRFGEELIFYFYCITSDGSSALMATSASLTEEDGGLMFNVDYPDNVTWDQIMHPGAAVNQAGELVLVSGKNYSNVIATVEKSDETPPPSPTPTPDNPTPTPENPTPTPDNPTPTPENPTPTPDNPTPTPSGRGPTPTPTPEPGPGSDNVLNTVLIIGIVAVIAAAVVAVIVLARKKNGPGSIPAQPITPTQPASPIQPTSPAPYTPERIEPVVINPPPRPKASVLYLCCEGGALDGRRYPIGNSNILIGRDPSCNICYPADTKGVSRRHCEIFWKNGVLNIMDLGSTSGTFIRGKGQITANAPVAVNAGDTFYLGEKRNAFVIRMGD